MAQFNYKTTKAQIANTQMAVFKQVQEQYGV